MSPSPEPAHKVEPVGQWRRRSVLTLLGAGGLAIVGRAFQLQVLRQDFLAQEGARRHVRTVTLEAHRGAIVDRRGEALALSAPVDSIWTVPKALLASPEHVAAVAALLELKPQALQKFLEERHDKQFVYLHRQMSPEDAARVLALKSPGVLAQREYRRYYPAGEIAAQLVGFCDIEARGQAGIEAARDASLSGTPGSRRVIRDARGRIVEDTEEIKPAQPGAQVRLNIDLRLQYLAYRELKNAVHRHSAKGGQVVVIDSLSGDVLAIASQPGFNPNDYAERATIGTRNRAIVDSFEPGSTIKPLLIAHALEAGLLRADETIDTGPGWYQVRALTVRDVSPRGVMSLGMILAKSSNVGAAKIGLRMGAENVWAGYQKFGLGEPSDSGFPGEVRPVLRHPSEWGEIGTATASYGYGLSLNALGLIRAYAALANDGLMPHLRLAMDDPRPPPTRVISATTARTVRTLMREVVSKDGTAQRAAIPGYQVAGKSGTVRKVSDTGGYAERRYQSAFVGMVPAERPRLIGLVMIDEPDPGAYYGGLVAAPVFQSVLQGALRLLQIPPDAEPDPPEHVLALAPGGPG